MLKLSAAILCVLDPGVPAFVKDTRRPGKRVCEARALPPLQIGAHYALKSNSFQTKLHVVSCGGS